MAIKQPEIESFHQENETQPQQEVRVDFFSKAELPINSAEALNKLCTFTETGTEFRVNSLALRCLFLLFLL